MGRWCCLDGGFRLFLPLSPTDEQPLTVIDCSSVVFVQGWVVNAAQERVAHTSPCVSQRPDVSTVTAELPTSRYGDRSVGAGVSQEALVSHPYLGARVVSGPLENLPWGVG